MPTYKLGKLTARKDPRTLKLSKYLPVGLPDPPKTVDWTHGVTGWGMLMNDQLGCCTIAGVAHAIQVWNTNAKLTVPTIPDADVVSYYEKWAGYNPADPNTDGGAIEIDVLNDWRRDGFSGHTLQAYADVNPKNREHIKQAIWLFGGVYIGLALPISANDQIGKEWKVTKGDDALPGSWGGHAVFVCAYDNDDSLTCITWGENQNMTFEFFEAYCDEAHALLSPDWIDASAIAPSQFDIAALTTDLQAINA